MSKKMQTLVLRHREWLRGKKEGMLLAKTGIKKCCLGVACVQLWGLKPETIRGVGLPSEVEIPEDVSDILCNYHGEDGAVLEESIAKINDDVSIDDNTRLKQLRPLFRKLNVKLEFQP